MYYKWNKDEEKKITIYRNINECVGDNILDSIRDGGDEFL